MNFQNHTWCYVNNGTVKHLVAEIGEGQNTKLVASCGFVPLRCWRTTAEAMRRCPKCVKTQKILVTQLQKQLDSIA